MKKILFAILILLTCTPAHAQSYITVGSFRIAPGDFTASAMSTRRQSVYGEPCALVKISTQLTGLSFDAGMECISDVVYSDNGAWLYIPAGTRTITISHALAGTLRDWHFPVTLESGRTYEMTLKEEKPARERMCIDRFSTHFIQTHIGFEFCGGYVEDMAFGLSYCYMPGRMGVYTSVDWNTICGLSFFAGPSIRLLDSRKSTTDWQLYAAAGITGYNALGVDLGTRFGWKSDNNLSHYDFSIGCQYLGEGTFIPYVGLGAEISVYTLGAALLALLLGVAGAL